jgi:hypothetical protein
MVETNQIIFGTQILAVVALVAFAVIIVFLRPKQHG